MANSITPSIAKVTKFAGELDKKLLQSAVTGFLADGKLKEQFISAKSVSIPDVVMNGLGTYSANSDFVGGNLAVSRTVYTLQKDRGRSFQIDREEAGESGVANLAGSVLDEFVRTQVVPEVDAYVLSSLYAKALAKSHTVAIPTGSTLEASAYAMLDTAITNVKEATGFDGRQLVAFVDGDFFRYLKNSSVFTKMMTVGSFDGKVKTEVNFVDGCAILPVDGGRMKTAFTFYDGSTSGQEDGGFVPATGATAVRFIVAPKNLGGLVEKTKLPRIFSPEKNLNRDAWKIDYRIYYDYFIRKSMEGTIYAHADAAT